MTEEKKKSFFSKIFGAPKSSCCNVQIEEVHEEEIKEIDKKKTPDKHMTK